MNDKINYRTLRNETFVFAHYKLGLIKEKGDSKSFIPKEHVHTGNFISPLTYFNEFVTRSLTKKPITPKSLFSLITDFKHASKTNLTIDEGAELFENLYSYIKDFKIFFFKHKSVPAFPLTCCNKLYRIFGISRIPSMNVV